MFPHSKERALSLLCLLCGLSSSLLPISGEKVFEKRSGMIQELRVALADLAAEGRSYMGKVAGEQTVLSVQKVFSQVLGVLAGAVASGLNIVSQYLSHFMQAAGLDVPLPFIRVNPETLIFAVQWVLLALIYYWLISLAFRLVTSTLTWAWWLLKVGVALACFGVILSDHSIGTETRAVRLAVLVSLCILFDVVPSKSRTVADQVAHLEEQVKILERRVREMERWKVEE